MNFKNLFISIALFGLIVFGLFSFTIISQQENDSEIILTDNQIINQSFGDLYNNLDTSGMQESAQSASIAFDGTTPTQEIGELGGTAVVSPTKIFRSMIFGIYNVLIVLPVKILGVSPIVASVISGILFLLVIIGIWAIWKGAISD